MIRKILLFTFIFLISLQSFSANFVCGEVKGDVSSSPMWMNVIVYYETDYSSVANCRINSEQKFCCSLEEIRTIPFGINKKVFAEVFDMQSGFVSEPVSLITTSEGFSVFPEISIKKAIKINSNFSKILINSSGIFFNVSLDERYNNLKYSINSSEKFVERNLCVNCTNHSFFLNLFRGKNIISLIAYGNREINETFEIYSLDYFQMERRIECDGCKKTKRGDFVIPSGELVNVTLLLNSSHDFSGKLVDYFPINFEIENVSQKRDYSLTHSSVEFDISGKQARVSYILESPFLFFPRAYLFKSELGNFKKEDKVRVSRILNWPSFFYFNSLNEKTSFMQVFKKISPENPIILLPKNSSVELIAIYPKEKKDDIRAYLNFEDVPSKKEETFRILTSLSSFEIEKILIRVKIEKNSSISLILKDEIIPLAEYKNDEHFVYYEAYINGKQFKLTKQ